MTLVKHSDRARTTRLATERLCKFKTVVEATSQNKNINYSLSGLRSLQDGNRKDQLAELPLRRL